MFFIEEGAEHGRDLVAVRHGVEGSSLERREVAVPKVSRRIRRGALGNRPAANSGEIRFLRSGIMVSSYVGCQHAAEMRTHREEAESVGRIKIVVSDSQECKWSKQPKHLRENFDPVRELISQHTARTRIFFRKNHVHAERHQEETVLHELFCPFIEI